MAKFYDPLPASQTPDWSKASKEPDRVRPNTAAGDALKNFAGIFEDAISGWDSIQKERNYETASKGEDQIYQDATKKNMDILTGTGPVAGTSDDPGGTATSPTVTGTPATATNTPGTGDPTTRTEDSIVPSASPLPVAVQAKVDTTKTELARLDAAQQSGRMSHIEVMAKRDALRRNLLAQNPGYRREIQAALGDTANQLYQATQAEVMRREAEAGAQKNKIDQQLWAERYNVGIDNPDIILNPDKYTDDQKREALQTGVAYGVRTRAQEIEKAQIAHDILTGNPRDNVSRVKQNLSRQAELIYNTEIRKMYSKFGFKDESDFFARVQAMQSGKASSEEINQMLAFTANVKNSVEVQLRTYASSTIPGSSYRFTDIVKDEDIKNAIANVGAKADMFRDAIVNKETGLIGVYTRVEKMQQEEYNRRLMEKVPYLRMLQGIKETVGGGEALSTILQQSGPTPGTTWTGQLTKDTKTMLDLATIQTATGTSSDGGSTKPTASQIIDQNLGHIGPSARPGTSAQQGQVAASNEKKVATAAFLDNTHRLILDPKVPTTMAINSASSIFRDNVIMTRVKEDERGAFLRKFTSNEVRDRMWALGQKDPQAWTDYRDWVDRHLNTNMNAASQSIREKQRDGWLSPNSNLGIRYNPQGNQVEVYQKAPLPAAPAGPGGGQFHQPQQALDTVKESLQKGFEPLNENLRAIGGVWEKEKKDITPEMLQRLAVLGIEVPGQQNIGPEKDATSTLPDGTKLPGPVLGAPGSPAGTVPAQPGTPGTTEAPIDAQKPQIANADGSVSTERTITIEGKDGGWVNIPTIVDGKQLTNEQAEALYLRGRNAPVGEGFATAQEAAQAAQARSNQIGQQLPPKPPAPFEVTDPNVAAAARGTPIPLPGRTDAGTERQRQQMLQERQQEQQRRALPGTPGGGNEVPIPRPRPANQPQPRDYTGIKLPYDVPPFAGSLLKGEIEKAGVWDRLPKALQDKVTKGATTWGGWQITKQDLDSLPQDVWEKLGERLGGTPGKRSEQSIPVQTMAYMGHLEDQPELLAQMTNTEAPKSQSVNAQVFSIATEYKGFHEKVHRQVLSDFMTGATGTKVNPATTPWCAGFANAVLANAGVKGPGGLSARAFLQWGTPINEPKQGDVVVISRGRDPTKGHVGFFAGMDGDRVKILAGNQGDAVTIRSFPAKSVLGYRRVKESDIRSFKTSMESSEELNTTAYAAGSPQDDIAEQVAEVTAPIAGALAPGGVDRIVQGETPSTNVEDRTQSDPGRDAMLARIERIRRDPSLSASEKKNEIDGLMAGSPGRQVAPSVAAEYQRTRDRALERSDLAEELKRGL
jgi:uncharacterized protein (TIGR02594 family)